MYRTLCVLALLTLQVGLAHCFSWDIVAAVKNRLIFFIEGKVSHSVTITDVDVDWLTYDPFHNRVLLTNSSRSLLSYDIATGKSQTLIDLKPVPNINRFTYDPATGLFFATSSCKVYSYLVKNESNHEFDANFVIDLGNYCGHIAVDSCAGYIYWVSYLNRYNIMIKGIERVRLNGSGREEVIESSYNWKKCLIIDPQTQNMYWIELASELYSPSEYFIQSADLNGKHRRTFKYEFPESYYFNTIGLTVSNDFIYWMKYVYTSRDWFLWKIPKNLPIGTDMKPEQIKFIDPSTRSSEFRFITAYYTIEKQTQGTPLCKALQRLLPNYSETNDSHSLNVSTDGSLLRVNETKISGESRVSGDTCDVSMCHNYCLQGHCSVSADGQPKCRCNAGYSGVRCEVNVCQTNCLHDGVCSLSEQNNPVCQCTGGYQGERCDVPAFHLLKDADLTSVTEGKGVKSTCACQAVAVIAE